MSLFSSFLSHLYSSFFLQLCNGTLKSCSPGSGPISVTLWFLHLQFGCFTEVALGMKGEGAEGRLSVLSSKLFFSSASNSSSFKFKKQKKLKETTDRLCLLPEESFQGGKEEIFTHLPKLYSTNKTARAKSVHGPPARISLSSKLFQQKSSETKRIRLEMTRPDDSTKTNHSNKEGKILCKAFFKKYKCYRKVEVANLSCRTPPHLHAGVRFNPI